MEKEAARLEVAPSRVLLSSEAPSCKREVYLCVSSGDSPIVPQGSLYHCQTLDLAGSSSLG